MTHYVIDGYTDWCGNRYAVGPFDTLEDARLALAAEIARTEEQFYPGYWCPDGVDTYTDTYTWLTIRERERSA